MRAIVEYQLSGNSRLLVEGDGSAPSIASRPDDLVPKGRRMRGGGERVVEAASRKFEEAIGQIGPAAAMMIEKLKSASPSEIEIEFGLKLEAEAGAIVTKAGTEAHFKVTLKWAK